MNFSILRNIIPAAAFLSISSGTQATTSCVDIARHMKPHRDETLAAVPPVTFIAAHTLRILQQVAFAKSRRIEDILAPGTRLHKVEMSTEEIAKLQDELYLCPFLQLIDDMEKAADRQCDDKVHNEVIAAIRDITKLKGTLHQPLKAKECLNMVFALHKICLRQIP